MEKATSEVKFARDKPVMTMAVIGALLAVINVILVFIRLRSNDFKVPVQYIVHDGSVLQTSDWYSLYSLALFSVLSAGATIFLAHRLHKANRLFAAATLVVYIIIGLVTLLATFALLSLVGRV